MTEPGRQSEIENRQPVGTVRFLAISVVFAAAATGIVWGAYKLLGQPLATNVLGFVAVSGFVVSTAGWYIVVRGFGDAPERMLAYFGAGMLTKLVLLGLTVVLVNVFELATLEEFFVPFAAVFFLTGFAQLYIAIKGAIRLLNEAEVGRVWEQPAAPGMARNPVKREAGASDGA